MGSLGAMRLFEKLILFSILPLFAVALGFVVMQNQEVTHRMTEMNRQTSSVELLLQSRVFMERFTTYQAMLEGISLSPALQEGLTPRSQDYLARTQRHFGDEIESLHFIDLEGNAWGGAGLRFNMSDRPFFADVVAGRPAISSVITSRATGQQVVVLVTPVHRRDGKLIGALSGSVTVQHLTRFIGGLRLAYEGRLVVSDPNHRILAAGELPTSLLNEYLRTAPMQRSNAARLETPTDGEWLVESATVAPVDWRFSVIRPARALSATITADTGRLLTLSVAGLFVALLIALFASRQLLKPLLVLQDGFAALAAGDMTARVPNHRNDELGDLGKWFNQTSAALEAHERRLRTTNELLESKVAERTAEIEAFSYSLSHDLRSYLRAVSGHAAMLQEDLDTRLGEDELTHLDRIQESVRRMSAILDGLQRLSHLSRVPAQFETVELSALAEDVAIDLARSQPVPAVQFEGPKRITVTADREMLRVLLQNVLGNAYKFSSRQAEPRVRMTAKPVPDGVEIRVTDNGVGIRPEDQEQIFLPFKRTSAGRSFEGEGIGLAIVARIVERHGGKVWAEPGPQGGTTIAFTLASSPEEPSPTLLPARNVASYST